MRLHTVVLSIVLPLVLGGCDQLGLESATVMAGKRDAEGKAIGAGCRHGARSVEECYGLNKRADKSAVFAGWREMNDYMRENKLDAQPAGAAGTAVAAAEADAPAKKP